MSSQAMAVFMLSRHWLMHLMPLVMFVCTYHNCLQHNTVCRAQQHAAVVAAHDKPCATFGRQCASTKAQSFFCGIFLVCSPIRCRWSSCKGVCPTAQPDADAAITTAFFLQVTTKRVEKNRKLVWPCLGDLVKGLEGCGDKVCGNLADTYAYAAEHSVSVPDDVNIRRNVATGQPCSHAFYQLCSQCVLCLQMCCVFQV